MILMGYSGAQGTLIYEKNLKSKISCQTPFKEPVAARAVTLALSKPQRRYTQYECGRMCRDLSRQFFPSDHDDF